MNTHEKIEGKDAHSLSRELKTNMFFSVLH